MVSDEEIFQSYHDLFMQIRDVVIKHKKAAGFHGSARILESLNKQADLSQRQLADEASIKPGSLTVAIEKLERQGLVTRKRDPHDKRIIRVAITQAGREQWAEVQADRERFGQQLLSPLTPSKREQTYQIAIKLRQALIDHYGETNARKEFFDD